MGAGARDNRPASRLSAMIDRWIDGSALIWTIYHIEIGGSELRSSSQEKEREREILSSNEKNQPQVNRVINYDGRLSCQTIRCCRSAPHEMDH